VELPYIKEEEKESRNSFDESSSSYDKNNIDDMN